MASNASVRPRFFKEAVLNEAESKKAGRPIYDEVEMVELIIPGDRLTRGVFLANEPSVFVKEPGGVVEHRSRAEIYADEYARFKRNDQRAVSGTPLEMWPVLTKARVMELKAKNILSVEELAAAPDSIISKVGSTARQEREQAQAWLNSAESNAQTQAQAAKIAQLEDMVEKLLAAKGGAAPSPQVTDAVQAEPRDKDISEATDEELKAFIKERTGSAPRGNPSRETLERMAAEAATAQAA